MQVTNLEGADTTRWLEPHTQIYKVVSEAAHMTSGFVPRDQLVL